MTERLARLHAEASPGPWWAYEDREAGPGWDWVVRMKKDPKSAQAEISDLSPPNAAFLVAAYNDLPATLAALKGAEGERDEARKIVAWCNNSAFGSWSYFTEASGKTLADAIEDLKEYGRKEYLRAEKAEAERDAAVAALVGRDEMHASLIEQTALHASLARPNVRMALAIAANAIRRGRHLTEAEKIRNLFKAMDEFDAEEAARAALASNSGGG